MSVSIFLFELISEILHVHPSSSIDSLVLAHPLLVYLFCCDNPDLVFVGDIVTARMFRNSYCDIPNSVEMSDVLQLLFAERNHEALAALDEHLDVYFCRMQSAVEKALDDTNTSHQVCFYILFVCILTVSQLYLHRSSTRS